MDVSCLGDTQKGHLSFSLLLVPTPNKPKPYPQPTKRMRDRGNSSPPIPRLRDFGTSLSRAFLFGVSAAWQACQRFMMRVLGRTSAENSRDGCFVCATREHQPWFTVSSTMTLFSGGLYWHKANVCNASLLRLMYQIHFTVIPTT